MRTLRIPLLALMAVLCGTAASAQSAPVPVAATPENAAPFLGDWTVSASGNYGPVTMTVSVKAADGKVVGEVVSPATGKSPVTDLSKVGPSLVLRYAFDYQGNAVSAVIMLTPGDNKVDAYLDFADGAAQMAGTATKKTN